MIGMDLATAVDQYAANLQLAPLPTGSLSLEELDYNAYVAAHPDWPSFHRDIEVSGFYWGDTVCISDLSARTALILAILRHIAFSDRNQDRIGPLEHLTPLADEPFLRENLDERARFLCLRLLMRVLGMESTEGSNDNLSTYLPTILDPIVLLSKIICSET